MLRTSEFMPYVVFIAAPELETLRAMHKAVVDAGITTKLLTVREIIIFKKKICVTKLVCFLGVIKATLNIIRAVFRFLFLFLLGHL